MSTQACWVSTHKLNCVIPSWLYASICPFRQNGCEPWRRCCKIERTVRGGNIRSISLGDTHLSRSMPMVTIMTSIKYLSTSQDIFCKLTTRGKWLLRFIRRVIFSAIRPLLSYRIPSSIYWLTRSKKSRLEFKIMDCGSKDWFLTKASYASRDMVHPWPEGTS